MNRSSIRASNDRSAQPQWGSNSINNSNSSNDNHDNAVDVGVDILMLLVAMMMTTIVDGDDDGHDDDDNNDDNDNNDYLFHTSPIYYQERSTMLVCGKSL